MAVNPALVAPLRAALTSQGFPPTVVRDDGSINPAGILAGFYNTVTFRSNAWPDVTVNLDELAASRAPNPFLAWARPTVVLGAKDGSNITIAPYGDPKPGTVVPVVLGVGALVGIGFLLGRLTK